MGASSNYEDSLVRLSEAKASGQAEAIRAAAQAHAEAQRANAGLYGQSIANIGQMVSQYPEQQAKLQQMRQEGQVTAFKLKEAQDAAKEQDAIKATLAKYGGDIDQALPEIMTVAPKTGLAFQKQVMDGRKTAAETHKAQLDSTGKAFELTGQVLGSVNDQPSWDAARKMIGGLDPTIAQQLPDQYDPDVVKRLQNFGMTQSDRVRKEHYAMQDYLELQKLDRGAPEFLEKSAKVFGQILSTSQSPEEWAGHIADAPLMGIPTSIVKQFPQAYSPEAVKQAEQLSMNPKERADVAAALARNTQAAQNFEVTKARLGIEQAHLGISQRAENRLEAQAAAANAPAVEVKPGSAEYQVAKDLAAGKLTMLDFQRLYGRAEKNAGLRQGIYNTARQLNPDFEPAQFELGFKMAGNPQIAQRVVAINAINPVMTRMEELIDKSGNTDIPALNSLLNAAKFQLGNQTVTNFRQLQTLLGDEIGNALGVGTGSDLKTKLGIDLVNPNLSPGNFRANMEQARTALQQRRNELYKIQGPYAPKDSQTPGPATTQAPQGAVSGRVGPYTYVVK